MNKISSISKRNAGNKKWRIILIIGLLGDLVLIFFVQKEYFIAELNHFWLGLFFLLSVLGFEFLSHIAFWKAKSLLSRLSFGFASLVLVAFSVFVTFSVQIHSSEKHKSRINMNRSVVEQHNKSISTVKSTIEEKRRRLAGLIKDNKKLIKSHQKESKWLAFSLIKKNEKLNKELLYTEKELLDSSKYEQKELITYTILENVGRKTNLNADLISLFNKAFLSLLLSIIPFSICYLLTRDISTLAPEKEEDDNDDENDDEPELIPAAKDIGKKNRQIHVSSYPIEKNQVGEKESLITKTCSKLGITKANLAEKLDISTRYLEQLEAKENLPKAIHKKLIAL